MKKLKLLALTTICLLMICASATAQNTSNSPATDSKTVSREQAISRLINETRTARELIKAQTERISLLEAELKIERENGLSFARSYEAAKSEITALRTANSALEQATALHQQTIDLLQSENLKQRAKTKKWRGRAIQFGIIAASAVLTKVL